MAEIKQKIEQDLKQALLNRDTIKVDALRMIKSSILNEEISKSKRDTGLSDEEVTVCLQKEVKKRKEAAEMYRSNNANDRAQKEEKELEIIQVYLPEQMTEEALSVIVDKVVADNGGDVSPKNMGAVIQAVRSQVGQSAQGGDIARLVKQRMVK